MELLYSQPNVINIFTDASTLDLKPMTFVCPGFIAVQFGRIIGYDYRVIRGESSQFAELYAVMMALTFMNRDVWSKRYAGRSYEVDNTIYNLFSDSMYSLTMLRSKISKYLKVTKTAITTNIHPTYKHNEYEVPDVLKKSKKKKKHHHPKQENNPNILVNQEVIMQCVNLILNTQKQINTYHIKAHLDYKNDAQVTLAHKTFNTVNEGIEARFYDVKDMMYWNDAVDKNSRDYLNYTMFIHKKLPKKVEWPLRFYPPEEKTDNYQNFIR